MIAKMLDPENEQMQVIFGEKGDHEGGFTKIEENESNLQDDLTPMRNNQGVDDLWGDTNDFTTALNNDHVNSTMNDSRQN